MVDEDTGQKVNVDGQGTNVEVAELEEETIEYWKNQAQINAGRTKKEAANARELKAQNELYKTQQTEWFDKHSTTSAVKEEAQAEYNYETGSFDQEQMNDVNQIVEKKMRVLHEAMEKTKKDFDLSNKNTYQRTLDSLVPNNRELLAHGDIQTYWEQNEGFSGRKKGNNAYEAETDLNAAGMANYLKEFERSLNQGTVNKEKQAMPYSRGGSRETTLDNKSNVTVQQINDLYTSYRTRGITEQEYKKQSAILEKKVFGG